MPLQSNATISDIITELSDMQAVNQKAELASVIGTPAVGTDNVATQITKLQTAKDTLATNLNAKGVIAVNTEPIQQLAAKVNNIIIEKRIVLNLTASTNTLNFSYRGGGTYTTNFITATGLSFRPVRITMYSQASGTYTEYDSLLGNISNSCRLYTLSNTITATNSYNILGDSGNAYVNDTGFRLPVIATGNHVCYIYG